MHDAAQAGWRPVFGDERQDVLPGIGRAELLLGLQGGQLARAAVDNNRLAKPRRELHLGDEGLLLDGDLGIVEVVVVEADLADGNASFMGGQSGQFFKGFEGRAGGLLRMDSCAGVDGG